ncbi:Protein trichome birefringence-like 34 [Sarracenia purpurea var. burkii]
MGKKLIIVLGRPGRRCRLHCLIALLFGFVIVAVYLLRESRWTVEDLEKQKNSLARCDLFSGKWVYDNMSYPLYKEQECPFMWDEFACQKFGRKDLTYQNWRWQPHHCDLPRFNATALLERLRGKRLVFVGDSLNRDQWVSMVCLVESAIPPPLKSKNINGSLVSFKATEYNASIDFYWAPMLVESNSDDPVSHRLPDRIVRIKAIEKHATHWTNADILVFDSYLWWRRPKMKLLLGSFESPDQIIKEVEMLRSYEMALKTWSDWLDIHLNRSKTQLYFMSMSPTHLWGEEWGMAKTDNCYNETKPIVKEGYWGSGSDMRMMKIVEASMDELRRRGLKAQMVNITQLSEYRKEAHPSIYKRQWVPLTEEQLSNPRSYADCVHWCLPGVPDVWNELLYAYIFYFD